MLAGMAERVDGRRLRYQHRRGELLEAVGEYVLENGVASLSLRRVGEAVGVSHVTLQHHFANIVALGCPREEARSYATLLLATLRGLVIDLLATGERERLDEAFETYLAGAERRAAEWFSTDRPRAIAGRADAG